MNIENEITYAFKPCIELELLDANCNNCVFMERDLIKFKEFEEWNKSIQLKEFDKRKAEAFKQSNLCDNEKGKQKLLNYANKLTFMFDKSILIHYGKCNKFNKQVFFIPNTCQIETQHCFKHRKEK